MTVKIEQRTSRWRSWGFAIAILGFLAVGIRRVEIESPRGLFELSGAHAAAWDEPVENSLNPSSPQAPTTTAIDEAQAFETIELFEIPQDSGVPWRLAESPERPVVFLFVGVECPIVGLCIDQIKELAQQYHDRVDFVLIDSNRHDSAADLAEFSAKHELALPLLRDVGNHVADLMKAERTPEALLVDRQRQVRYRGRIDDQYSYGVRRPAATTHELTDAIEQLLRGEAIAVPRTAAIGCQIGKLVEPDESAEVTYSGQIAAILDKHCLACHRRGEIGPFSMEDYEEVAGWSEMIAETVEDGRMPPWHASPEHGEFSNDSRLTDEEKRLLYDWAAAGAPLGEAAEIPPSRSFAEGWQIGEPDLVVEMAPEPFAVPASGELSYQYFVVDPGFETDRWVRAAECRPGNRSVVHHIIVALQPPDGKTPSGLQSEWLCATAPGAAPMSLPDGMAKRIPAGSKLVFQMHYTTNGRAASDLSRVGFIFADEDEVKNEVMTQQAVNTDFKIPPHATDHQVESWYRFHQDSIVTTLFPHMHLRGRSFRYIAHYPDGKQETLLDIPRFDFNWQNAYVLKSPKFIPAGTRFHCVATFDNSSDNLANPNPEIEVRWGDQTREEMMIGYFDMYVAPTRPE